MSEQEAERQLGKKMAQGAQHDDDAKMSDAEAQSERKRPGTELVSKAKHPKKSDDDDDGDDEWLFDDEWDSDLDIYEENEDGSQERKENDFWEGYGGISEFASAADDLFEVADDFTTCLDAEVCNVSQHSPAFPGLPVFELFKVILKFNDKSPIKGELHGEIVTVTPEHGVPEYLRDPENPFPITYYSARRGEGDIISLDASDDWKFVILPLHGPTQRPPICNSRHLNFDFALRVDGKDLFAHGCPHTNRILFGDDVGPVAGMLHLFPLEKAALNRDLYLPRIIKQVLGDPKRDRVLVCAKYAEYPGVWARIKVKMMKEGVTSFCGLIMARPCIFYSRFRLLTIPRASVPRSTQPTRKGTVGEDSVINLTRSLVVVPSYSSLIIGAELYVEGEKDDKLICRGRTCFPPQESGEVSKYITYKGDNILQVIVIWECRS